jgi:Cu+-exporting ATPase
VALQVAGAVEAASEHPIARAIDAAATAERPGAGLAASDFSSSPGQGASARVDVPGGGSALAAVGKPSYLAGLGLSVSSAVARAVTAPPPGTTAVAVAWETGGSAALALEDWVRGDAADGIGQLKALGVRPYLVTGDSMGAAQAVAGAVGIAPGDVAAGVTPEGKVAEVRRLRAAGRVGAMVGDGVTDAAAIAAGDLGFAMGSGTDVARSAADITLVRDSMDAVPQAIRLSRATLRVVKQNLGWAFGYNTAAVPLAALGLAGPMVAGAAMAASSLFVVLNALRLARFERRPHGARKRS